MVAYIYIMMDAVGLYRGGYQCYYIAGKFGRELNLVVRWTTPTTAKLKTHQHFLHVYVRMTILYCLFSLILHEGNLQNLIPTKCVLYSIPTTGIMYMHMFVVPT